MNSPVEQCEVLDDRTVFGRFRSLYSGHSYDNTDVGEVPDSSVSLRPFFFLAYLSESGRIYVGSQYLGQFGGYTALFRTLRLFLPDSDAVASHSFRHDATSYRDAKPKSVRVNFSRKPAEITGSTKFGQRGAMTFKQNSSKDEEFKTTVATNILAKLGQSDAALRKAVADMLAGNEMLSIRDEDIEDCAVVATVNGKDLTINVIEAGHFATRFPLDIAEYIKGHPEAQLRSECLRDLYHELFYNVSYFNLIAVASIIVATGLLLPTPEVPGFLRGLQPVEAYVHWLRTSKVPAIATAVVRGCAMFVFYMMAIEVIYSIARVIGRTSFYFERKMGEVRRPR